VDAVATSVVPGPIGAATAQRATTVRLPRTVVLSTYVPNRCGIATFARDLVQGLRACVGPDAPVRVAAVDPPANAPVYPPEVRYRLRADDRRAYRRLATDLEADGAEVLCMQHEFGLFGGPSGRHVLDLLEHLSIPVVTTLHTILSRPTKSQARILREIAARSARLVTISERGRKVLLQRYGAADDRIAVVPHGVPDLSAVDRAQARSELGLDGAQLILTFGLLGPSKNVELVLEALHRIADRVPDATIAVVGATHPEVRRQSGERYRDGLLELVHRLGLADRVRFVDRYLTDAELAAWLVAADVFVTPYRDAQQMSSGTLAYALAAGTAVISTPYAHASELLQDGRGLLVPFEDPDALARALASVLLDDEAREAMRRRGREHGRSMLWPNVALKYARLFVRVVDDRALATHAAPSAGPAVALAAGPATRPAAGQAPRLPERLPLARGHLDVLRTSIGIHQFARGRRPDPVHGSCTDDVARTLRVDLRHADVEPGALVAAAIRHDLDVLRSAFNPSRGRFRNFRAADGSWLELVGSEDSHGRAVHALGEAVVRSRDRTVAAEARGLLAAALPAARELAWARPRAYAILGCVAALADPASTAVAGDHLEQLAAALEASIRRAVRADPGWPWPERRCTYDNGTLPEALIAAGMALGQPATVDLGLKVLAWLVTAETAPGGWIRPVGNRGWWSPGSAPAAWDQQPIEPASLVSAAFVAWEATRDDRWAATAERALAWFLGANDLGIALADPRTGGCRDGLGPDGANANQGAESTLAWLVSVERVRELRQRRSPTLLCVGRGQDSRCASTSERLAVASAIAESAAP
jgi:glycosyltransferase involved in cell wall biosynthesis